MLKLLISFWDDGVVEACRYMFAMGSDVVLVPPPAVLCNFQFMYHSTIRRYIVIDSVVK